MGQMSLVGSEVDIVSDHERGACHLLLEESDDIFPCYSGDDDATEMQYTAVADLHPPLSPPRPAESLFMSGLSTQTISAAALAQQLHLRHRSNSSPFPASVATSVVTDDFYSCTDINHTPSFSFPTDDDGNNFSPFSRDVFNLETPTIDPPGSAVQQKVFFESKMTQSSVPEPAMHVDAAEKVYEGAKGIWAWGKGIFVFKPFMSVAEGVASKVLEVVGSSMEDFDGTLTGQLHGIDDKILNPAIHAIVGIVVGTAGESPLKPFVMAILKPLGLIKDAAETPEKPVSLPALTTPEYY